ALSTSCVKLFSIDCEQAPAADDDDGDETEEEKKLQRGVRLLRRTPRSPKRKTGSSWLRYQEAHDHQLYTKLEGQKLRSIISSTDQYRSFSKNCMINRCNISNIYLLKCLFLAYYVSNLSISSKHVSMQSFY
ncbi:unnamed protein product, partial [Brassica oleracea var. botrytis]